MNITETTAKIRELLLNCSRPLFLFDDDPDGLSSFLLLYNMIKSGKGNALKGSTINEEYAEKVNEYSPDLVVILDKPKVEQEFFDKVRAKCVWIDHHNMQNPKGVIYLNPRSENPEKNIPTSQLAYNIVQDNEWIATVGIVADWCLPPKDLLEKTVEKYGNIISVDVSSAPEALFNSDVGKLAKVFSFNLKGRAKEVYTAMKILSRISHPKELLNEEHGQARLIMKQYKKHNDNYQIVLREITKGVDKKDTILLYKYSNASNSYTTDLSNELLYRFPNKFIIIARKHNDTYRCSLRSHKFEVEPILQRVLTVTGGTGGGHLHACGSVIDEDKFDEFVELIKEETEKANKK